MKEVKTGQAKAETWASGSYADFLGLTTDERLLIEFRASIRSAVRRVRTENGLTQAQLAKRIESGQSRVAKIESGASDVSLDLICRALFAAGGTLTDLARAATEAAESDRVFEAMKNRPEPAKPPKKPSHRVATKAGAGIP
jgi:transcriptional regulator with XRE-family HTH domain